MDELENGESHADNEENVDDDDDAGTDGEKKNSNKFLHDITPVVSTSPINTYSSKYDANDEQNINDNASDDQDTEVSDKFFTAHRPVVQTSSTRIPSKIDLKIESNVHDDNSKMESSRSEAERIGLIVDDPHETKVKENIEYKSLNEYLNKHEKFLKSINHTRQLSSYEQKQLDRQKEDLKKLQGKLVKQVEENDRKHIYQKQKEDDNLRKKRAYLQRRVEEEKLKQSRKPRVQTTYRLPIHENGLKSHTPQKKTKVDRMTPSSSSTMSHPKSIVSHMPNVASASMPGHPNHVGCQTDTNYFDRMNMKHQLDNFDKYYTEHPNETGTNLKELITQFVEHSKQSWINE